MREGPKRPRLRDDVSSLIEERRGLVPFDAFVNDLLVRALEQALGTTGAPEASAPAPAEEPVKEIPLPKIAPRRPVT